MTEMCEAGESEKRESACIVHIPVCVCDMKAMLLCTALTAGVNMRHCELYMWKSLLLVKA